MPRQGAVEYLLQATTGKYLSLIQRRRIRDIVCLAVMSFAHKKIKIKPVFEIESSG